MPPERRAEPGRTVADPDPWRTELRNALERTRQGGPAGPFAGRGKASEFRRPRPDQPAPARGRSDQRRRPRAGRVGAAKAQERHPRDVWVNYVLGTVLEKQSRARRGDSLLHRRAGDPPRDRPRASPCPGEAGRSRRGHRRVPRSPRITSWQCRDISDASVFALETTGRAHEAEEAFEAAVVAGREEVRLKPGSASAHDILGHALKGKGQLDEAIA